MDRQWSETTYGAVRVNIPSPQCYQIWRMECNHCDFFIEPSKFRRYREGDEDKKIYGNFASISHSRKLMREHVRGKHPKQLVDAGK